MAELRPRALMRAGAILVAPVLAFFVLAALPFPVCQSRVLFGLPCPGCGLTRATDALVHLDLLGSLRLHPLAIPVLLVIAVELVRSARRELGLPAAPMLERIAAPDVRIGLAAGLIGVFVLRFAGGLGGLPDSVDPRQGLVVRGAVQLVESLRGLL